VVLAIIFLVALILARIFTKNKEEEGIYIYAFSAPNISYLGFVMIEAILGKNALSECYTFLGEKVYVLDDLGNPTAEIDLKNSIYIDWGAFIIAIINFLIVAFVLFCIVKTVNSMRENSEELEAKLKKFTKEDRKIMKERGIKPNKKNIKAYLEEKEKAAAEAKAKADAEAKAKAEADRLANPTTEDLLKSILEELKNK
jgi:large-conductance mechanosensitive channel